MAPTVLTFKFGNITKEFKYDSGGSNCCPILRKYNNGNKLAEYISNNNTINFNNKNDYNNAIKFFNDIDKAGNNNGIIEISDMLLIERNEDKNDTDGLTANNSETAGVTQSRPQKDGSFFDLEM